MRRLARNFFNLTLCNDLYLSALYFPSGIIPFVSGGIIDWINYGANYVPGRKVPPLSSWIAGFFTAGGYLTHLILDELYSVDLYGAKLKKSFGTALTFFSWHKPLPFLVLYATILGAWQFTPDIQPFLRTFSNHHLWQKIEQRLLPR